MISSSIKQSIEGSSWIRKMFEEGSRLKKELGEENVFDLSLGNPVFEPPKEFEDALKKIVSMPAKGTHRYMSNAGFEETRAFIAEGLQEETALNFSSNNIVMCVGAGGGLNVVIKTLCDPGDEIIGFAPYFPEYLAYAQNHQVVFKSVDTDKQFQIDFEKLDNAITKKTKIVLINSPNNPTGVVYEERKLKELGEFLTKKSKELNKTIYLLSDEPYRKILFDNLTAPSPFLSYSNTILVTSNSKDLALPGERIGFIAVSPESEEKNNIFNGLAIANRILGFVNAPALMQRVIVETKDASVDVSIYEKNRDLLYNALSEFGYECVKPKGAFYFFPKCLIEDDLEFINRARSINLLLTPGRGFGKKGFFRISYCFETNFIEKALVKFEELKQLIKNEPSST